MNITKRIEFKLLENSPWLEFVKKFVHITLSNISFLKYYYFLYKYFGI